MEKYLVIQGMEQLGIFLKTEAFHKKLKVSYDTHYDAQNWELSWWKGNVHHRLDFQPLDLEVGEISITHYQDHFPVLSRFFYWAYRTIPLFPYYARVEWSNLAKKHFPLKEEEIRTLISMAIEKATNLD